MALELLSRPISACRLSACLEVRRGGSSHVLVPTMTNKSHTTRRQFISRGLARATTRPKYLLPPTDLMAEQRLVGACASGYGRGVSCGVHRLVWHEPDSERPG
jgi:hypothetical protein